MTSATRCSPTVAARPKLKFGWPWLRTSDRRKKRAILSGHFRHGGNPLLRMCFGNVVAEKDAAENERFTKEKARGRIDGAVAPATAVGRIIANEVGPSPYERMRPDGFIFV
ncbi:MAG: hypothetical protein GY788_08565 [bacterium]|nr:hypothetical protein [bacterium]